MKKVKSSMAENSVKTANKKRRRGPGRQFKKGESGNPGGRPKDLQEVKEYARVFTKEAMDTLVGIMRKGPTKERRTAAERILDRGWGKTEIPITGRDGGPVNVNIPTLVAQLQAIVGEPPEDL